MKYLYCYFIWFGIHCVFAICCAQLFILHSQTILLGLQVYIIQKFLLTCLVLFALTYFYFCIVFERVLFAVEIYVNSYLLSVSQTVVLSSDFPMLLMRILCRLTCCCWDGLFDFGILKFHSNVLKCEFFVIIFIELGFVVLPESEDLCLSSTLKGFLSLYLPCMFFNNSCYLYFSTSLFCISEL